MIPLRDDNPASRPPIITVTIITITVLAFFYQISLEQKAQQVLVMTLGAIPATLIGNQQLPPELAIIPPAATLFTSMFLHGGWLHLIGNMLYLWIFGDNVESAMGHVRFVIFYIVSGVIAALAYAIPNAGSVIPMIGASGAISGVLGAYLLLYPHAKVLVLIPFGFYAQVIRLPAMAVLGFWFVLQIVSSAFTSTKTGGVAWGAHIGGFVAGMVLIPLFKQRSVHLFSKIGR
jgi:rhomboid family protein